MKVAIIGGGPAGFLAAITLKENNPSFEVVIFERAKPLASLLYTGGGRCNITNAEFDFKELAFNYPRGEKFLYSVFSRFGVGDLFEFFNKIGVELYTQPDNRVFPVSDNAEDVRGALLDYARTLGVEINPLTQIRSVKKDEKFVLNDKFLFDKVVIATGGKNSFGYDVARGFGHGVGALAPVLCGMKLENPFPSLAGVSLKNIAISVGDIALCGDFLFTHRGISGPVVFDLSSYLAFAKFPICAAVNFTGMDFEEQDVELIRLFGQNSKKNISNILTEYFSHAVAEEFLQRCGVAPQKKAHEITSSERKKIAEFLTRAEFVLTAKDTPSMVTAGGVCLDEVDKNLQSKIVEGLYFCGEILDIDGLCGGYNLQACFSTGHVVGSSIK